MAKLGPKELADLGQQLRVDSVRSSAAAGSGHPTSSMSAADLIAVLLANHLRYDFAAPEHPGNDHLIFSKGHASPLLYAMYKAAGAITDAELLTFRQAGSRLEGHPTPALPWVDVATGSLGQGLPIGVGIALAGRQLDRLPYHVWVLCGDSELAEGSVWEAFEQAGYSRLGNLIVLIDVNRLGQQAPTRHGWDLDAYSQRIAPFGWRTIEIDGHDVTQIGEALAEATATTDRPTAILARTVKGRGVSEVENKGGAHGKPLTDPDRAVAELGGPRNVTVEVAAPPSATARDRAKLPVQLPPFEPGTAVATRTAFGKALAALGDARGDVVVLDGEVSDSTRSEYFANAHRDRFFEFYIAEQQMIAAGVGMQARGWTPYIATFAAFLTRAYDFIRMAAISRANLRIIGSHAGVAIGQDGPSQMGLEDLAAFRAVHGSTVLYPCDGNQTARLVAAMADQDGICYLRTTRGDTPVIYPPDEEFVVGGSRVARSSPEDRATVVAAGVTLHEALRAADQLAAERLPVRVIDLYSVKPLDEATLRLAADETGHVLTVEDHWPEGGLGDAVLSVLATGDGAMPRFAKLAVTQMPASASPAEQLQAAGIDAAAIVDAVRAMVKP